MRGAQSVHEDRMSSAVLWSGTVHGDYSAAAGRKLFKNGLLILFLAPWSQTKSDKMMLNKIDVLIDSFDHYDTATECTLNYLGCDDWLLK
jgi:hypothetical protein